MCHESLLQIFFLLSETTVWAWMRGLEEQGRDQFGVAEPQSPAWGDGEDAGQGLCFQMALGSPGGWRRVKCAGKYQFICENEVNGKFNSEWQAHIRDGDRQMKSDTEQSPGN